MEYKLNPEDLNKKEELKETEKTIFSGCSKCDAGYINGSLCDCLRLEIMKRRYSNANIDYDFASLPIIGSEVTAYIKDDDSQGGRFEIDLNAFIDDYVDNHKMNKEHGKGIIFGGPTGRGKSLSSMKILMKLVDKGYSCHFLTIKQFMEIVKKSWNDDEYKVLLNKIYNVDFLVIDDLGVEYHKEGNDWALTEIDDLFRQRYYKKLAVIMTTNSSLDQLKAKYAERIISLFHERLLFINILSTDDYREKLSKIPQYLNVSKFKKAKEE